MKPQRIQFEVRIKDQLVETSIERQGHGFQRTLLLSALRLLADSGNLDDAKGVICLAIEEPELYQHPAQAKSFATVLRKLADDSTQNLQIMYATHNPIFIEPRRFEQVRRIVRTPNGNGSTSVRIYSANKAAAENRLDGLVNKATIQKNLNSDCLRRLSFALFADVIVLVEGDTEQALIDGTADRGASLHRENISVTEVGGKDKLLISRALLEQFGIPSLLVADTDSGIRPRLTDRGNSEQDIVDAENQQKTLNRKLLKLVSQTEADWPSPGQHGDLIFMEDTLETFLESKWPSWEATRQSLIKSGNGYDKKHSLTYYEAAVSAPDTPPAELEAVLNAARALL